MLNFDKALARVKALRGTALDALKSRNTGLAVRTADAMGRELMPFVREMNEAAGGVVEFRLVVVRTLREGQVVAEDMPVAAGE